MSEIIRSRRYKIINTLLLLQVFLVESITLLRGCIYFVSNIVKNKTSASLHHDALEECASVIAGGQGCISPDDELGYR
jgi:hypothetical protein